MDHGGEVDLTPLILHNASSTLDVSSPTLSRALIPQVLPRPISKRRGKKRSARACTSCRFRKVRCNIVAHGAPCSNCRHDEIDCVLPLSRRQKSARDRAEQSARNSTFGSEAGGMTRIETLPSKDVLSEHSYYSIEAAQSISDLAPHGMRVSEHMLSEILPPPPQTPSTACFIPASTAASLHTKSWSRIQAPLASAPITLKPLSATNGTSLVPDRRIPILPAVFTPFPRHIDARDLAYLHSRDALTLPSEKLQVECLKSYMEFVHSSMPILDLEEFLSTVNCGALGSSERKNKSQKQTGFVLFQAVMFAGVEYVPMRALREEGYGGREEAVCAFFSRVKLLYDFDTAHDRLQIIQALLLMTLFSPTPPSFSSSPMKNTTTEHKTQIHYLTLAISLLFSLGLHRSHHAPPSSLISTYSSIRKRRLERRVFWVAFIRDRVFALNNKNCGGRGLMGRDAYVTRIKKEDCDIDMLSLDDFEFSCEEGNGEVYFRESRRALDLVEKAGLCWGYRNNPLEECSIGLGGEMQRGFLPFSAQSMANAEGYASDAFSAQSASCVALPTTVATPPRFSNHEIESNFQFSHDLGTSPTHSSSTNGSESVLTPRQLEDLDDMTFTPTTTNHERKEIVLGAGFGVDGEYDDYLEFLRPTIEIEECVKDQKRDVREKDKERARSSWAFGLDCENGRVSEV